LSTQISHEVCTDNYAVCHISRLGHNNLSVIVKRFNMLHSYVYYVSNKNVDRVNTGIVRKLLISTECYNLGKVEVLSIWGQWSTLMVVLWREIREQVQRKKCYFGLTKHLSSELLSRKVMCLIYKTSVIPGLTYGSETWPMG
jgi:hypothetical protein